MEFKELKRTRPRVKKGQVKYILVSFLLYDISNVNAEKTPSIFSPN